MPAKAKVLPLTPKQEKFCQVYLETGIASDAYRAAYSCEKTTDKSVNELSSRLLADVKIASRVAELKAIHLKRHTVTVDRVLLEYSRLAFLDARKAFNEDGSLKPLHELDDDTAAAIAGMEVDTVKVGETTVTRTSKIKLSDKLGALNSLGRHLAMFTDKAEVTGKDGSPLLANLNIKIVQPTEAESGGDR